MTIKIKYGIICIARKCYRFFYLGKERIIMKKLIKFLMIPSSLLYKEAHSNSGGFIPPFFFDF